MPCFSHSQHESKEQYLTACIHLRGILEGRGATVFAVSDPCNMGLGPEERPAKNTFREGRSVCVW